MAKGREALKYERWLTDDHVGNHSRRGANDEKMIKRNSEEASRPTKSHLYEFQIQLLQIWVDLRFSYQRPIFFHMNSLAPFLDFTIHPEMIPVGEIYFIEFMG